MNINNQQLTEREANTIIVAFKLYKRESIKKFTRNIHDANNYNNEMKAIDDFRKAMIDFDALARILGMEL